jgi:solute carrier family 25 (mitochondrial aspartate/glutamate transporter), member 12/13
MSPWNHIVTTVHCDSDGVPSLTASAIKGVRTALDIPERELKRWRRIFDTNAKVVNGEKWVCNIRFLDISNSLFEGFLTLTA